MIELPAKGEQLVEAQVATPAALVQLVRYNFSEPPDSALPVSPNFRVELCLTARHRSARGNFRDLWAPHRFEHIGDVFIAPPNLELAAKSDEPDSLGSVVCELAPDRVLELFEAIPELNDALLAASLDVRDATVRGLLLRMADETRNPGFAGPLLVDLLARQLAVELVRLGAHVTEREARGGLAPWQLRLIDERLAEAREAPTLPVLAGLCRLSVRQLTRGFRSSRGCSIGAYVAGSQMEHAKRLLAADEGVSAIAATLGFSSSSNFCFAFRRATGLTPGDFRRKLLRH
jgi:AraC family transcriptional regulator